MEIDERDFTCGSDVAEQEALVIKQLRAKILELQAAIAAKDAALRDIAFDEEGYCLDPDAEAALAIKPSDAELRKLVEKVERATIERCARITPDIAADDIAHVRRAVRALPTGQIKLEDLP